MKAMTIIKASACGMKSKGQHKEEMINVDEYQKFKRETHTFLST
jgi:hypothetical protein